MINDDIDAIIQRGEQRTAELSNRYEGLSFEDLSNFKSEASVQQWEGEDFRAVCDPSCLKGDLVLTDIFAEKATQLQPTLHAETGAEDKLLG